MYFKIISVQRCLIPKYTHKLPPAPSRPPVHLHMSPQVPALRVPLPARRALVRPLPRMRDHVILEVLPPDERLPAHVAPVLPHAPVLLQVHGQVGARDEPPAALGAGEGALVAVEAHVYVQVAAVGEALLADGAPEGGLAGVGARVVDQGDGLGEGLAADVAHVGPLAAVRAQVGGEGGVLGEALGAAGARVRTLAWN